MIAFHGDLKIKKKYLARVSAHEKADEIMQGYGYWKNGKGCAVGCTLHGDSHADYETELGIPRIIARLEDGIFEQLPNDLAKTWPRRFLECIKPGADLSMVWPKFAAWMLTDEEWGVIKFAKSDAQRESIQTISDMYLFKIEGAELDAEDWLEARRAADAYTYAYAAAAAAAADAYADADADAADAAAAAAAAYATYAYAYTYAYAATARRKIRTAQSEKLIELLKDSTAKSNQEEK